MNSCFALENLKKQKCFNLSMYDGYFTESFSHDPKKAHPYLDPPLGSRKCSSGHIFIDDKLQMQGQTF